MTLPLLIALLLAYVALAALFVIVAWPLPGRAKWLGLGAITVAVPVFVWLGGFNEQYAAGQCYSSSIGFIANAVAEAESPQELAEKIRALPLRGAETECLELEAATKLLPHAEKP